MTNQKKTMVLIDAYSQIFRAFFAIRMLNNSRGEPVNAAYVFTKLLMQIDARYPSDYGAMLFDCGKVAFRRELAPEYKANRPPMPDALKQQMPLIREISGAFGWDMFQCEGYEADDLIGAMTERHRDLPVFIVSGDKDLSQLVDDRVSMLVPAGGSAGFTVRGRAEVEEKFGVAPELMVDYLALLGDASDNIPGVSGIGPKGAAEILRRLGGAENWLDHPEKIDPEDKLGKKLLPGLETVRRNRALIRLRTEYPAGWSGEPPVRRRPDWGQIARICRDNQFNSILKDLPVADPPENPQKKEPEAMDLFAFAAAADHAADEQKEVQGELF